MTQKEALQEARKRWGNEAYVHRNNKSPNCVHTSYSVYSRPFNHHLDSRVAKGHGTSWEAAFADAGRREKQNRQA